MEKLNAELHLTITKPPVNILSESSFKPFRLSIDNSLAQYFFLPPSFLLKHLAATVCRLSIKLAIKACPKLISRLNTALKKSIIQN